MNGLQTELPALNTIVDFPGHRFRHLFIIYFKKLHIPVKGVK